jgi:hypothetical protein
MLVSTNEEVLLWVYCLTRAQQGAVSPSVGSSPSKKDATSQPQTPLEKLLLNAGPIREDGSDKFFGMENVWPFLLQQMAFTERLVCSSVIHGAAPIRKPACEC